MKLLIFVFIFLPFILSQPLPFERFEGFVGNYIIGGTVCTGSNISTTPSCVDTILVLDSENDRMFLDLGNGGRYWMFHNESYITLSTLGNQCGYLPGFNYTTQKNHYARAFAIDDDDDENYRYNHEKTNFLGTVWDVGSCTYPVSVNMRTERIRKRHYTYNIVTAWNFQQEFPFRIGDVDICARIDGRLTFYKSTFDTTSDRSIYFDLPSSCDPSNIINYCSAVYYPNQQCSPYLD